MTNRSYRGGGRDRYDRDRNQAYGRQEEQFEDLGWRDEERGFDQLGEVLDRDDHGQFDIGGEAYGRVREPGRRAPRSTYGTAPQRAYGGYGEPNERGFLDRAGEAVSRWFGDADIARRRLQDHTGHGPAGYIRSDERILEDANDRLTEDWGVDAREVQVAVSKGEVKLDGTVPSRQQKRRAEDLIDGLSGIKNVQNNLRVQESTATTGAI